jgi:hypothetical protein
LNTVLEIFTKSGDGQFGFGVKIFRSGRNRKQQKEEE